MKFSEFNLDPKILKGIEKAGFEECMPAQERTFTETLIGGKDVCVQSQTGTGKTAAFLIPIFELLLNHESFQKKKALVIAPTRELAVQIEKEAVIIGHYLDIKIGCFYGGIGYATQEKALEQGVDLIIGTPGRLIDFGEQRKLDFSKVGILVIDEADRLFDMGFLPDIRKMLRKMPPFHSRRTMLFSATLDYRVKELAWEHMNEAVEIEISPEKITVENITQELYHVGLPEKMPLLLGILKKENPRNALIFTNTKHMAHEVSKRLNHNGYNTHYIMGDLPQKTRLKIIEGVKSGKIKYLVATEVAARGLHIEGLDLVLNYDLPTESESYVHRIGRTARAGKSGKAISFACEKYVYGLEAIEALTQTKIPVIWPDEDLFVEDKSAGMRFSLESTGKGAPREKTTRTELRKKVKAALPRPKKAQVFKIDGKEDGDIRPRRKRAGKKDLADKKTKARSKGRPFKKISPQTAAVKPGKKATVEDRLRYYKEKYGEDFNVASNSVVDATSGSKPTGKPKERPAGFLHKILGFFKK